MKMLSMLAALLFPSAATAQVFPLVKVVDGDTLTIRRGGKVEKLRLLCVDTEEVTRVSIPGKPSTALGDAASAAIKKLLECDSRGMPESPRSPAMIRIEFEEQREERGNYGRLLVYAHARGVNLNLYLVRTGFSPYFTKYGYSRRYDQAMVAAEREARRKQLGIWNPRRGPNAARDYTVFRRWWDLRARAIEAFRRSIAGGARILDARAQKEDLRAHAGEVVTVFGAATSLTLGRTSLRLVLEGAAHAEVVAELADLEPALITALAMRCREGSANFLYVRGRIQKTRSGCGIHPSRGADFAFDAPPAQDLVRAHPHRSDG